MIIIMNKMITVNPIQSSKASYVVTNKINKELMMITTAMIDKKTNSDDIGTTSVSKVGIMNLQIINNEQDVGMAAITINENSDPSVRVDLMRAIDELRFVSPTSLIKQSICVPINRGRTVLGVWQGLYFMDFNEDLRDRTNAKDIAVTAMYTTTTTTNNNNQQQQQQQQKEQEQCTKSFLAPRRGFHDAHECVETALDISNIKYGLMNVLIKHTSASLTINDPKYATELEKELNELIPERWNDEFLLHTMEGRDDCPAHIKATLVGETMNVPIKDGKLLLLSEDDRMMICEHRNVGGYTNGFKRDFVTTAVHGIDQKICTIENKGNKIFNVSDIIREFVQNNNKEIKIVHVFAPNGGVFISRIEDAHAFYERVVTKITSKALRKSIVGATEMLTCCDGTVEFGGMSAFVVIDSESRTTTTTEFVLTGL
jgi:secondary thiamine-phosphate synthase enzyme